VTVPPEGVSTPLLGSRLLADAVVLKTTELSASPAVNAAIAPIFKRVVPINFFTGSLLVRVVVSVLRWVNSVLRCCAVPPGSPVGAGWA
jgi:hypothetical protein